MNYKIGLEAATSSGSTRSLKIIVDCDGSGQINIHNVTTAANDLPSIHSAVVSTLGGGSGSSAVKYLVFDAATYPNVSGVGSGSFQSYVKSSLNLNAITTSTSVTYGPYWTLHVPMHEMFHTFGAAQQPGDPGIPAPPFSTAGFHCTDGLDILCYQDAPAVPYSETRCPESEGFKTPETVPLDCGYDTYFDAVSESGEWLDKYWNTGGVENPFLYGSGPPVAQTTSASSIGATAATLNGLVNPQAYATTYRFEYGTTTSYGTSIPVPDGEAGSGASSVLKSASLTGLQPKTTYHYRIVANNTKGSSNGEDKTFTTPALKPTVAVQAATSVKGTSATLNAEIDGHDLDALYRFQYLTDADYDANGESFFGAKSPTDVPAADAHAGTQATNVRQTVTGLEVETTYHYRVTAHTSAGESISAVQAFTTESGAAAPAVDSDVDGDTRADLITLRANGVVYVHPGNSETKFGSGITSFAGGALDPAQYDGKGNYVIDTTDIDGDVQADLVTLTDDGDIQVYAGKSNGTFNEKAAVSELGLTPALLGPGGDEPIASADVDGDGYGDLISYDDQGVLEVSFGSSDGTFGEAIEAQVDISSALHTGHGHYFIDAADVTGDGRADLVSMHSGDINVLAGKSDGTFSAPVVSRKGEINPAMDDGKGYEPIGVGDITGDAHADLTLVKSGTVYVYPGSSEGSFGSPATSFGGAVTSTTFKINGACEFFAPIDVDGDSYTDLGCIFGSTDQARVGRGQESGVFSSIATSTGTTFLSTQHFENQNSSGSEFVTEKPSWRRQGCATGGCIANDDTVGMYRPGDGAWYMRYGNSSGASDVSFEYNFGSTSDKPVVGDWDGDGDDTIGMYKPIVGTWNEGEGVFHLRNSNSPGAADTSFEYNFGSTSEIPVVGDWDGDGDDTIGMYQPVVGTWNEGEGMFHLRNSNSSGAADYSFAYNWANPAEIPVVGDWDGDGDVTIGMFQPGSGYWYLRNSNSSGAADYSFGYAWGAAWDVPIVGEWDGD